ncbi:MAG: helix-turn-helix domain-containing protein, partial [Candidatus Eisenbacteria bacterium]|nr:helix-turn-helix domain-containing protein [Candidatus Eisenbacteria bacterium]
IPKQLRRPGAETILTEAQVQSRLDDLLDPEGRPIPALRGIPRRELEKMVRIAALATRCALERRKRGLWIYQIAERLAVRQKWIRAIEEGDVEQMKPLVVRGYLRFLGLGHWAMLWTRENAELAARIGLDRSAARELLTPSKARVGVTPSRPKRPARYSEVFQLRVVLKEIHPEIWRRILVPSTYSFWDLHVAIQDSMGWLDFHHHRFHMSRPDRFQRDAIGVPDDEPEFESIERVLPGWEIPIATYFTVNNRIAEYLYDFADGWSHLVVLEAMAPRKPGVRYPACTDGERRCPPEDIGGIGGYEDFLCALRDPRHPAHLTHREWAGESYNPNSFAREEVHFDDPIKRWSEYFLEAQE